MGKDEVVVEYRGYLLIRRVYSGSGTSRIRRPDGTWRYSVPTVMSDPWIGWVIAQSSSQGAVEEMGTASDYEAARQWVDRQLQSQA